MTTATDSRRPLRVGAVKRCPSCDTSLDGGPVHFRCGPCGRAVMAADIDTETHRPLTRPLTRLATPPATTYRRAAA